MYDQWAQEHSDSFESFEADINTFNAALIARGQAPMGVDMLRRLRESVERHRASTDSVIVQQTGSKQFEKVNPNEIK